LLAARKIYRKLSDFFLCFQLQCFSKQKTAAEIIEKDDAKRREWDPVDCPGGGQVFTSGKNEAAYCFPYWDCMLGQSSVVKFAIDKQSGEKPYVGKKENPHADEMGVSPCAAKSAAHVCNIVSNMHRHTHSTLESSEIVIQRKVSGSIYSASARFGNVFKCSVYRKRAVDKFDIGQIYSFKVNMAKIAVLESTSRQIGILHEGVKEFAPCEGAVYEAKVTAEKLMRNAHVEKCLISYRNWLRVIRVIEKLLKTNVEAVVQFISGYIA